MLPLRFAPRHLRSPGVRRSRVLVLSATVVLAAACDEDDGRTLQVPTPEQRTQATNEAATTTSAAASGSGLIETAAAPASTAAADAFALTAPWPDGAAIDARYSCDGEDVSPALSWTTPPAGTVELALVMSDDDVGFVHWAITGLPAAAGALDEGAVPVGVIEAVNDFGDTGWGGPCPPDGETHTYRFQLYALTAPAGVEPGVAARDVVTAIEAIPSTAAVVTGTFGRG